MEMVVLTKMCHKCKGFKGRIDETGPHRKLSCFDCGAYIKMLKKNDEIIKQEDDKAMYDYNHDPEDDKTMYDIMKEANFKLDVLLSHLGVME